MAVLSFQISSLDQVFILDFRGLFDHNASKSSELVQMIQRFMRNLLSDPDILKVGWEFCNSDVHMLMKNCNGKYLCRELIESIFFLFVVIIVVVVVVCGYVF